ncbi:MAG: alpha/beta hydrolase [Planctomycetes bacterium]|nr:alpha/beta hydrolase [Planctomycetota bacterium]
MYGILESAMRPSGSSIEGRLTIDTLTKRTRSTIDGLELAYWLQPAETQCDRYVLLVHGAASNHTRWSELVEHTTLTRTWNIIFPDMRGNGASMTRGRQDMEIWCADLADILAAERASVAVVIGHSLGAQIAVQFARRHPDRVLGLVLIDPVFQRALRGRQLFVRRYRWLFRALAAVVGALNVIGLRRRHVGTRDLRELDEETRRAIAGPESMEEIAKRYGALGPILRHMPTANYVRQGLATVSPLPDPEEIDVPVQVLISGGTTLADLDLNRSEAARFPNSEVVVLEANHWPLTETPDTVREAIEGWMAKNFGGAS